MHTQRYLNRDATIEYIAELVAFRKWDEAIANIRELIGSRDWDVAITCLREFVHSSAAVPIPPGAPSRKPTADFLSKIDWPNLMVVVARRGYYGIILDYNQARFVNVDLLRRCGFELNANFHVVPNALLQRMFHILLDPKAVRTSEYSAILPEITIEQAIEILK